MKARPTEDYKDRISKFKEKMQESEEDLQKIWK
jgi:hypothetical protein